MLRSMTGFGQAARQADGFRIQVEMKSVNHRYLENLIRIPRAWMGLEEGLKKTIQQSVKRGRVEVFIAIERDAAADPDVQVNWPLAKAYVEAAGMLKDAFRLPDSVSLAHLLQLPEIVMIKERESDYTDTIGQEVRQCVRDALDELMAMRETEGRHLREDLLSRIAIVENIREDMLRAAPQAAADMSRKLRQRLRELLADQVALDETRFATEVAVLADRANIDEELTRLASHFAQFRQLADSLEPVGRKLDFLLQEMNREANTIGSKANDSALSAKVVELKAELEKIREQAQNIE